MTGRRLVWAGCSACVLATVVCAAAGAWWFTGAWAAAAGWLGLAGVAGEVWRLFARRALVEEPR